MRRCMSSRRLSGESTSALSPKTVSHERKPGLTRTLAETVKKTSLCGLGQAAPNPVISTITHFRDEYDAHIREKRCPTLTCRSLVTYTIDPEACTGCTACARKCPVECIDGERKQPHVIDGSRCIRCGRCFEVCKFDAVKRK